MGKGRPVKAIAVAQTTDGIGWDWGGVERSGSSPHIFLRGSQLYLCSVGQEQ